MLYTLNINYNNGADEIKLHPNRMELVFKSGFNTEVELRGKAGIFTIYEDPAYRGSELYIDDVSLVYDK